MRTKWQTLIVGAVSAALLASCRGSGIWSGAAFRSDGTLQVAAEEPICGCLTLTNRTDQRMILRSELRGSTIGAAVLNPVESRKFRFDWVGQRNDDVYILEGMDESGRDLDLRSVTRMEARPVDCESPTCIYDTLLLNVATEEER